MRRILEMGGPGTSKNFENNKDQKWNFSHPESVRFSCPKSAEDKKKRSSLKFSPVFGPKLGAGQKQRSSHTVCVLKPFAQLTKEGPMPQFCILFYAKCTILATQRVYGTMPPPNTPLGASVFLTSVGVYLTDIYFDIVWEYYSPGDPPKSLFWTDN